MSKKLFIVRDERNKKDKGSDRFFKAIKGECRRNDVEVIATDSLAEINNTSPILVLEPSNIVSDGFNSMDIQTTAKVCLDQILIEINESSTLTRKEVLIFGNGEVVGRPLRRMLREKDVCDCSYINSKTSEFKKDVLIEDADIIVLALPYGMKVDGKDFGDKIIIDCSDSYDNPNYSVRDIGKLTVQKIIQNVINN